MSEIETVLRQCMDQGVRLLAQDGDLHVRFGGESLDEGLVSLLRTHKASLLDYLQTHDLQDDRERRIAAIWEDVLGVRSPAARDNFFLLGGHSVLAMRLIARLAGEFGVTERELSLKQVFENPTIRAQAALVQQIVESRGGEATGAERSNPALPPIRRVADRRSAPLSHAQQSLWFAEQGDSAQAPFNMQGCFVFHGELNHAAFREALRLLMRRHEALRTNFRETSGEVRQYVDVSDEPSLNHLDLSDLAAGEQAQRVAQAVAQDFSARFDLHRDRLFRVTLVKLARARRLAIFNLHHLIADGWSIGILIRELSQLYSGTVTGSFQERPAELPAQYVDYVHWQNSEGVAAHYGRQTEYWKQRLSGIPAVHSIPLDYTRPARRSYAGALHSAQIAGETLEKVRAYCRERSITPFMFFETALALLISYYSQARDVVIGTPVAARAAPETQNAVGLFLNTVALRTPIDPRLSFDELLHSNVRSILEAFEHQDVPFERLVGELGLPRDRSVSPIFQVWFVFQNNERPALSAAGCEITEYTDVPPPVAKHDLNVYVSEEGAALRIDWVFNPSLFAASSMACALREFVNLVQQIVADPGRECLGYPIFEACSNPPVALPVPDAVAEVVYSDVPIVRTIEWHARRLGIRTAVVTSSKSLTYSELVAQAERFARAMPRDAEPVGLLFDREPSLVAAMLGALRAGCPFVPLDPEYPPERLQYLLAASGCRLLLTSADHIGLGRRIAGEIEVRSGDEGARAELPQSLSGGLDTRAYVLFTSGSTGRPKGVVQSRANLAYHAASYASCLRLSETDRILQLASFTFDASLLDTWGALIAGASVHLEDLKRSGRDAVLRLLGNGEVTVVHATPTVFKYLFGDATTPALTTIRAVVLGGEPVDSHCIEVLPRVFGQDCELVNLYGSTESSLSLLKSHRPGQDELAVSCGPGAAIAGTQVRVCRSDGSAARLFEPGELVIESPHVALGYCLSDDDAGERFRETTANRRQYRTGDAAYLTPDGEVRLLGRLDRQVKLNGIRVELGEIEARLALLDDVTQSAVEMRPIADTGEFALVTYVVSKTIAADTPDRVQRSAIERYRAHLRDWLPEYMVPGVFVFMTSLPLTSSGKVDRQRLPTPQAPANEAQNAPADELEEGVIALWRDVLGMPRIAVDDDFFLLGGHSLMAMRLIAALGTRFGTAITLRQFFTEPTVRGCAALIRGSDGPACQTAEPLTHDPMGRHAPFPLTPLQQAYWLGRSDVFELGHGSTQSYSELTLRQFDPSRFSAAVNGLIARHDMLRVVVDGDSQQRVLAQVPAYEVAVADLRGMPEERREAALEQTRGSMSDQTRAVDRWPLFDIRVSLLPGDEARVHLTTDTIALDARSRSILGSELLALYAEPATVLPEPGVTFRDFVVARQAAEHSDEYRRAREYWLARLDSLPAAPELPLRTGAQEPQAPTRRSLWIEEPQWLALKNAAARCRVTLPNLLMAAFADVLSLWSKSSRFCLNLTLFNRDGLHEQIDRVAGQFSSSLLLDVDLTVRRSFIENAQALQQQLWKDMEHRQFSGVEVLRALGSRSSNPRSAQMPVVFTSTIGVAQRSSALALIDAGSLAASRTRTSQVYLDCQVGESNGRGFLVWNSLDALFCPGAPDDMFAAFRDRAQEIAAYGATVAAFEATDAAPGAISIPARQRQVRETANSTAVPRPTVLLQDLFAERARANPHHLAVVTRDVSLTYAQLDTLSNALAHQLRDYGARVNELVGVVLPKGWEQVVAVLGILKSGAPYVPNDPSLPEQRRQNQMRQAEVRLAVTTPTLADSLQWDEGVRRIVLTLESLSELSHEPLPAIQSGSDLAYVIFTSGSTGVPKGVMIEHAGAVNTLLDLNRRFAVSEHDAVLALSALNFDLSVYDIFGLLAAGGTIVMPHPDEEREPDLWTALIERHGVTIWNTVPALAQMRMDSLDRRPGGSQVRLVMMSGDWIPTDLPARLRAALPDARLFSLGGATEASIWSILYPIETLDPRWTSVPYGKPLENQSFRVLKEDFRDCPDWVAGHLYIGGEGLARGYWRDSVKTAASFITHPHTGERLYRTGDLGRYLPDGNIEFLGRQDDQVKVNGYRIELGDVEAALLRHPAVDAAVVVAVGERARRRLVGYFTTASADPEPERAARLAQDIQSHLRAHLPHYMVPTVLTAMQHLPLTANGKVDRRALAEATTDVAATRSHAEPTTEVESRLSGIWSHVLKVDRVGLDDNFFELGGNSLLATRAVALIRQEWGVDASRFRMRSLFDSPTVRTIAREVEQLIRVPAVAGALAAGAIEVEW